MHTRSGDEAPDRTSRRPVRHALAVLAAAAITVLLGSVPAFAQYPAALPLPPHAIGDMLMRQGFTAFSPPRLRGDVFILEAVTARGARVRLTIDAYNGDIIDSGRLSPPGAPPQDIGRGVIEREPPWPDEYEEEVVPNIAPEIAPVRPHRDTVLEPPNPAPAPAARAPQAPASAAKTADPAAPPTKTAKEAATPADAKAGQDKPAAPAVRRSGPVRVIQGVTPVPAPVKPEQ